MGKHLRRWGAIYILAVFFLGSWIGQFVMILVEVGNEARQHGEAFSIGDFWVRFWSSTFENWQSEWLQLLVQGVMLLGLKHTLFKADAEDTEKLDEKLDALLRERGIDPLEVERRVESSMYR